MTRRTALVVLLVFAASLLGSMELQAATEAALSGQIILAQSRPTPPASPSPGLETDKGEVKEGEKAADEKKSPEKKQTGGPLRPRPNPNPLPLPPPPPPSPSN
jgi:hypothetical protein